MFHLASCWSRDGSSLRWLQTIERVRQLIFFLYKNFKLTFGFNFFFIILVIKHAYQKQNTKQTN